MVIEMDRHFRDEYNEFTYDDFNAVDSQGNNSIVIRWCNRVLFALEEKDKEIDRLRAEVQKFKDKKPIGVSMEKWLR